MHILQFEMENTMKRRQSRRHEILLTTDEKLMMAYDEFNYFHLRKRNTFTFLDGEF